MMLNVIDAIGAFKDPIVQLLAIVGLAAIVDGVRLMRTTAVPDASDLPG